MALEDVILPKAYKNSKVLFEQNLDKWRLKAQDAFANVNFNLTQIAKDTFLPGYEYDNDGNPNYAISLEARINQFLGGGAVITGTASPTWTVNTLGNSATETTAILTAPRTYQWPDVSGTYFLNFATQPGNIIGVNQITANGGSPFLFNLVGGAHTNLTAGAEASDFIMNWARTVTFATGAIANQRAFRISAPTYAFNGASVITNAATVYIGGAPIAGVNATLTNSWSLWVDSGDVKIDDNLVIGGNIVSDGNIVWKSGTAFTGTLDHANTANRVWTLPDIAGEILLDAGVQTVTGAKSFNSNTFLLGGGAAGKATLIYEASATSRTHTVPDAGGNDTFAMLAAAQNLTNKTLTGVTIAGGNITADLTAAAGVKVDGVDIGAHTHTANAVTIVGTGTGSISFAGGGSPSTGSFTYVVAAPAASTATHGPGALRRWRSDGGMNFNGNNYIQVTDTAPVYAAGSWTFQWNMETFGDGADNWTIDAGGTGYIFNSTATSVPV